MTDQTYNVIKPDTGVPIKAGVVFGTLLASAFLYG